jgi:lipopolysaccharide transport system ATP-binding protein
MSDSVITVSNLGKRYRLSHRGSRPRYTALRDVLADKAKALLRNREPETRNGNSVEDFWALKDVSFEIKQGEVVGIIGRNGAGKSTLLKILSRITEPTEGRVHIKGRVASLLEVGTGFHPELTGRENIFLNGAILGMSRAEIRRKFDEIVAFAEVEKFLDTPVKRYSSGMYVRLAFAVAAHLEPEILIVDEVLAVGDTEFQKKCLGKMENVATRHGRTVLFVSHNLDALRRVCQKGLLLVGGQMRSFDSLDQVLEQYLRADQPGKPIAKSNKRAPSIRGVQISTKDLYQGRLKVEIEFWSPVAISKPTLGIVVYTAQGTPVFGSNTLFDPFGVSVEDVSAGMATIVVDPLPLWSGQYRVSVWLTDTLDLLDYSPDAATFDFLSPETPPHVPSTQIIGPTRVRGMWTLSCPVPLCDYGLRYSVEYP